MNLPRVRVAADPDDDWVVEAWHPIAEHWDYVRTFGRRIPAFLFAARVWFVLALQPSVR